MVKVNLPPGCVGFETAGGNKVTANRAGGTVDVTDRQADAINRGQYGQQGFISASGALALGTRKGRECPTCSRVWNAWSRACPKCGKPTVEWPAG